MPLKFILFFILSVDANIVSLSLSSCSKIFEIFRITYRRKIARGANLNHHYQNSFTKTGII